MLNRMSIAEKMTQLMQKSPGVPSLNLVNYDWWSEATHGVASGERASSTTNFAFPITTGMAFNRTLWRITGAAIGTEARAAMNNGTAYSTLWAPVVNLAREPRWGRNIETPGEDPYLSGEYAVAFVRGVQELENDPNHILASACCKHFVGNSMENSKVSGQHFTRHEFSADIGNRDLVDSYMPPFQACVERGHVTGLMCSYNAVNGVPSCANSWLLNDIARGEWGFDGYVTSDCGAEGDVFFEHNYTGTGEEAVAAILRAGTDLECGQGNPQDEGGLIPSFGHSALEKGLLSQDDIDTRLAVLLRMRMRLGHFDPLQYRSSRCCHGRISR